VNLRRLTSPPTSGRDLDGYVSLPTFRMLAGSFDSYDVGGSGARPLFGWVARQNI